MHETESIQNLKPLIHSLKKKPKFSPNDPRSIRLSKKSENTHSFSRSSGVSLGVPRVLTSL